MRIVCTIVVALAVACGEEHATAPRPIVVAVPADAPPTAVVDAGTWANHVAPAEAAAQSAQPGAPELRSAVMSDEVENSDEPVAIGRLVYRVNFYVPASFRDRRVAVRAPAGELHIDVSADRLRARFIGPGWPVPEGSQVRLRPDLPGAYLFDGNGGRSLGAGQLAAWFEGRESKKMETLVGVSRDYGPPAAKPIPAQLLCALFAEWSHQERQALAYRCDGGSLPPGFRVGPWSGELTAVVPMELPRRALRADEADPPAPIVDHGGRVLLEPAALARMPASRVLPGEGPVELSIDNRTNTRAIVIAQGVPIAWVDADRSLTIPGFNPGFYSIGAIRPLGILRMTPKLTRVPGQLVIGRPRVPAPIDAKPAVSTGEPPKPVSAQQPLPSAPAPE
jgi:hypothetical protein